MNTVWIAAILAIGVAGYFAWSSQPTLPPTQKLQIDECHRLAGQVRAIHEGGGAIPADLLATARSCTVSFGQDWAATGGQRAAELRAEGAARVR
jgi:hypothetical protein